MTDVDVEDGLEQQHLDFDLSEESYIKGGPFILIGGHFGEKGDRDESAGSGAA